MCSKSRMKKLFQVNRELIPLKLVLFMFAGAVACIFPYLTVHMKQIGLTIEETAIVYAVLPISAFVGPPIAGVVADRLGRFQPVLITCLTISAALYTALLAIPHYKVMESPRKMEILCFPNSTLFRIEKCAASDICQNSFLVQINTTVELDSKAIDSSQVVVPILFPTENNSYYSNYSNQEMKLPFESGPNLEIEQHLENDTTLENGWLLDNGSRMGILEQFIPSSVIDDTLSSGNVTTIEYMPLNESMQLLENETHYLLNRTRRSELSIISNLQSTTPLHKMETGVKDAVVTEFLITLESSDAEYCYYKLVNFTGNDESFNCSSIFIVNATLFGSCTKTKGNNAVSFWSYFFTRNIANIFAGTTFSLLDATSFTIIKEHNADYGKQKLWSTLATAVFSPITGILLDYLAGTRGYMDYAPAFYVFDFCILITICLSFFLKIAIEEPSGKMLRDLKTLMKKAEIVIYFMMIFFLGAFWGFIETFMYWFLIDLGSSTVLLGLTVTIGSVISLPALFSSEKIIQRIGNVNVLLMAFLFYSLRLMGYSMIYNPWWSLALEFFEVFTLHLMWVAAATYGAAIAPKGLLATLQGATGGIHYGIGKGIGSFSGGTMMQFLGARTAFRIMALVSAVCGGVFLVVYFTYLRRAKKVVKVEDNSSDCKEKYIIDDEKNAEALQTMLK